VFNQFGSDLGIHAAFRRYMRKQRFEKSTCRL